MPVGVQGTPVSGQTDVFGNSQWAATGTPWKNLSQNESTCMTS